MMRNGEMRSERYVVVEFPQKVSSSSRCGHSSSIVEVHKRNNRLKFWGSINYRNEEIQYMQKIEHTYIVIL